MPSALRASSVARCTCARPGRAVVIRASAQPNKCQKAVGVALSAVTAVLLTAAAPVLAVEESPSSPPVVAEPAAPQKQEVASTATSISFARVDMTVTKKLRERDDNMAWKCKGVNMYDCDGELAAAAEKRFDEISSILRGQSN